MNNPNIEPQTSNHDGTICALATPTGGALGIIRMSGAESLNIISRIFTKDLTQAKGYTLHYGSIKAEDGTTIDEVLVTVFRAPHSYTGEDSVEISCHGSRYIINKVLEQLIQEGCRMAEPGEYTQRAYLNGKMDLSQAEAVADLIASTNKATHHLALSQLRGNFSSELSHLREKLLKITSLLELELDFSDHEELEFADRSELLALAIQIENHITSLAKSFETGQALKQGIPVAIVGKTNVGKSTLLNRLLKDERAIVSNVHGTTRDTIEDTIDIHGVTFRFIDTAGIRQTSDTVELIGIERTYQTIDKARIVLWLLDEAPTASEQQDMQTRCEGKKLIIIITKSDKGLPVKDDSSFFIPHSSFITISAKYDTDLSALEETIYSSANIPDISENDIIITNARHYNALMKANESLTRVIEGMGARKVNGKWTTANESLPGDLLAEDLRLTLSHLAEITGGTITPNEVLQNIFSHFCVGK
ncbi:MAG: tRNA uridine-5-carboxymethylaminomethyl(34) synthesis GTPase MnmE [Prevotella sp.]|nr:tRNA uridine-5-carboxymethylaminomethyl(34) synthesis GTPase MnmE [Prevotella sp.]